MRQSLFLFGFLLFTCHLINAQAPPTCPSSQTPAADACEDACIQCNLAEYTGNTLGYTPNQALGFCGTIENEQWLGFIAAAPFATVTVMPSNCLLNNGMQIAVYSSCGSTPIPGGCNGGQDNGGLIPVSVSVALTPGEPYFLMIDSYAGDICDFTLSVSPPGAITGGFFSSQTIELCPGETYTIDGQTYSAPATVQQTIPAGGAGCDTVVIYNLVPADPVTISETYTLFPGEPIKLHGNTYFAPDTLNLSLPSTVGCDTLATYYLLLDQSATDSCSFFKVLGDPASSEAGNVIAPSSDGNFYIAGEKDQQSLLIKVTPDGEVIWSRAFQPVAQAITHITDLFEDSDGMLGGCGIVGDGNVNLRGFAFRYNPATGTFVWSRLLQNQSPELFAIRERVPGGNYILLTSPQLTFNVDDAEFWEFNRTTGAPTGITDLYSLGISDVWTSMVIHDQAIYVTGRHIPTQQLSSAALGKMRMGLSKISLIDGKPIWTRLSHVDTSAAATLYGQDLIVHNNALVSVYNGNDTGDPNASPAFFLQKTSLDGDLLWVKRYDTPVPAGTLASDIQRVSDGYIIIGAVQSSGIWTKIFVKTDFDGQVLWAKQIPSAGFSASNINALTLGQHQSVLVNNALYVAATTTDFTSDIVLLKMTTDGELGNNCTPVLPLDIQGVAVANPANLPFQLTYIETLGKQAPSLATTVAADSLSVTTFCVGCQPVCDDTLDLGPDVVTCNDTTVTFNAGGNFVSYLWQDGSTGSTFTTNIPGIYSVAATDACGDVQHDTVLLTVSLVGDIKLVDTALCIGNSLTLSVPGFDTYQWAPSAGLSCDTCETVTIQPALTTTYSLFAQNAQGCTKSDTFTVTVLPLQTKAETVEFCTGDVVVIGGNTYSQSGTVVDTIPGTVGCDTVVTYTLTALPYNTSSQTISFCPGKSVTIGGNVYNQSGTVVDTVAGTAGCDTIITYTLIALPYNTSAKTISFCPGETVTIGGNVYSQAGTVVDTVAGTTGCDTIITYTLIALPYNTSAQTISFCPGETVTIGGNVYNQSGTVIDTIPAAVGCDTIATYTLVLLPQPTFTQTIEFCSGESVTIGGTAYTQPGTVVVTLPAATGCDTIATYILKFIDTPNSSVSLDCPANINVTVDPGSGPVAVNYNAPTVSSDCECPGIALNRTQGPASGSPFPVGSTTVCYAAKDSCGNTATCCFLVEVTEETACDVKTIGCMKWELLGITRNATTKDLKYRIRVTNTCANKLIYTAFQVPDGLTAVAPANNSVYTAPSGRQYDVRNPNYTPFYSVRFKSKADSIANGQSDIFEYQLPPQINPAYIHVNARLATQQFFEAHLNTFNCPIEVVNNKPQDLIQSDNRGWPEAAHLVVYPNPTSGTLFADLSDWTGEQLQIRVFDSRGQRLQLLTVQAADAAQQIALPESLASGLYFLEVSRENGEKRTARFVVQR